MARVIYAFAASAAWCAQAAFAQAAEPRAAVEGALSPDLRAAVVSAIGETDRPIENRFEARRRARQAAEDAIAVLRSEGYYANQVDAEVGEGDAPKALVKIVPGPRFVLAHPQVVWVGAAPDAATEAAALGALGLKPGEPGRAADVVSAEGRVVAAVQKRGYADVKADPREVDVDHADQTVQPTYKIEAGPIARLDGIRLVTAGHTQKSWLQGLAPWKSGDPYDPADVAELERRLLDTGVYESVTVALAPASEVTADGLRPIVVSLAERKPHTIEAGASYGTTEGAGIDLRWTRYGLLGRADTLALIGRLSNLDSRVEADLTLPHWRLAQQTLTLRTAIYRTSTPAYDQEGAMVSADVTHRFGLTPIFGLTGTYFTWGGSLDLGRTSEVRIGTLTPLGRDVATLAGLAELALDRSDDPLNPRHGWRIDVRTEPTLLAGQGTVPYLKVQGQVSTYIPFGAAAHTVLALRAHVGSILNGGLAEIPAPQRFYAGGGGSVRGFGNQEVGPRLADNTPQGGLALLETSAELRRDLTQQWGVVAFVDAGAVAGGSAPDFQDLSVGAGFGVRYNLGFGPIRVDVASPDPPAGRGALPGLCQHRAGVLSGPPANSGPSSRPPTQSRRERVRRKRTMIEIVALAVLIAVAAVGFLVVSARYGVLLPQARVFIEARTNGLKVGRLGRLQLEGLSGDIWRDVSIRRLTIRDEAGVWLEAENAHMTWRYLDLLRRRFHADRIEADDIRVLKRPTLTAKGKDTGLPVSFEIDQAKARLILAPEFSYARGVYDFDLNLDVGRKGGAKGRVRAVSALRAGDHLNLDFDVGTKRPLVLEADVQEARGGALAGALGLPSNQPFAIRVTANGKISEGQFAAVAALGPDEPVRAQGFWDKDGGVGTGRMSLTASTLTAPFARRLGPEASFVLAGRRAGPDSFALDARAEAANLKARAWGVGDVGERRLDPKGLQLDVSAPNLSRIVDGPQMGPGRIAGRLAELPDGWRLVGSATVSQTSFAGYTLAQASGPLEISERAGAWAVKGALAGVGGGGTGLAAAALGASPTASFDGSRLADGRLALRSLQVTGQGLKVEASGGQGLLGGLTFKGRAEVSNLAAARAGAGGSATADWSAAQARAGQPWTFGLDLQGQRFASGYPELDRLLGAKPKAHAQASLQGRRLAVGSASLQGAALRASTAGVLAVDGGLSFKLDWSAEGPFHAGPIEVAGKVKGSGAVTGTLGAPRADLIADVQAIDAPRMPLKDAHLVLSFLRKPDGDQRHGGGDGVQRLWPGAGDAPISAFRKAGWT